MHLLLLPGIYWSNL